MPCRDWDEPLSSSQMNEVQNAKSDLKRVVQIEKSGVDLNGETRLLESSGGWFDPSTPDQEKYTNRGVA